jgi:hypothetical protein
MESAALFPEILHLRVPADMPAAVRHVARLNHQSGSEWVRRVLLREIVAEQKRASKRVGGAEGVIIEQRERAGSHERTRGWGLK